MKPLLWIIDALCWAFLSAVTLGVTVFVGWGIWITLRGVWGYLLSREGQGLGIGLGFGLLVWGSVRWLSWRSSSRRAPIIEDGE